MKIKKTQHNVRRSNMDEISRKCKYKTIESMAQHLDQVKNKKKKKEKNIYAVYNIVSQKK